MMFSTNFRRHTAWRMGTLSPHPTLAPVSTKSLCSSTRPQSSPNGQKKTTSALAQERPSAELAEPLSRRSRRRSLLEPRVACVLPPPLASSPNTHFLAGGIFLAVISSCHTCFPPPRRCPTRSSLRNGSSSWQSSSQRALLLALPRANSCLPPLSPRWNDNSPMGKGVLCNAARVRRPQSRQ